MNVRKHNWAEEEKRYRSYTKIIALLLLVVSFESPARAERLPLKTYTIADGLAHNVINKIVRDSRGFLWFCTEEGLSRFDGYAFTNYGTNQGLPHPNVNALLETREGEYWLATNGGLVKFNPRGVPTSHVVYMNQTGTAGDPMFTILRPDGDDRYSWTITSLLQARDGMIWCGTLKGLYRLEKNDGRFALQPVDIGLPTEYAEQHFVNALLEDRHGTLWIGAISGLYRHWPDGSFSHFGGKDGLPRDVIQDLLEDRYGYLWIGTRQSGLLRLATEADHRPPVIARSYDRKNGLGTNWVFDLYESGDSHLWVGTNKGLTEIALDETGPGLMHAYTKKNGLSYHEISSVDEDRDGNLWLGTNSNGAMKLARRGFTTFDERDGINSVVSFFESNEGELYASGYVLGDQQRSVFEGAKLDLLDPGEVGYYRRLGHFDGQQFNWFLPDALKKDYLGWSDKRLVLQSRSGEWWIATGKALYLFPAADSPAKLKAASPVSVYTVRDLGPGEVYCIYEDSRGDLWISMVPSTGSQLYRWERKSRSLQENSKVEGLSQVKDLLATSFSEDRAGDMWVGFAQGKLARYRAGRFEVFTNLDGLPVGGINALYLDHAGRLWIAWARSGVTCAEDPTSPHPTFVNYTTADGFSSNSVSAITEDRYGRIYVGTGQGLDEMDTGTRRIRHYTTADGLAGGKTYTAFCDRQGWIWVGTTEGLSRFLPEHETPSPPPPILISALRIAASQLNISALGELEVHLPDLAAGANELQIDFLGLSFAPGESLRYQYKLEGTNSEWSVPSSQRTVNYANLAPGHYRFLVRAVNSEGVLSAAPAVVTFIVLPHLWQRWWFLALVVIALALMIYALYRYRVARILEVANMRMRIATDLHDDIGANLTKIALLSEIAKRQTPNGDSEEDHPLSSIARISRESVASMGDIVWAINPERDHLIDLTRRMRREAEELFAANEIKLSFEAPVAQQDLRLGVDVRRDLFLIFKEASNNSARHSRCSQVTIDLSIDGPWLWLRVADDGVGFDPSIDSDGQGLESMRRRAEALGGKLTIQSNAKEGTTVLVQVPHTSSRRL